MRILVVLPRFPYPLDKGDKLRAFHQMRLMARRHEIYLFCTSHTAPKQSEMEQVMQFCKEIRVVKISKMRSYFNAAWSYMHGGSLQLGYWNSQKTREAFAEFERRVRPDALYCQMVRTMPWVADSKTYKVLDFQDALSLNTHRRSIREFGWWKGILEEEARRLESVEHEALEMFDRLAVISKVDRSAIVLGIQKKRRHRKKIVNLSQSIRARKRARRKKLLIAKPMMDRIAIVPNGIDTEYYSREAIKHIVSNGSVAATDILFCGNMQYEPNVTAATFLVERIMPNVWRELPDVRVTIAGANPTRVVRRLAGKRVNVTGRVADMRPYYASARIFVAPMLSGSGLQNKLLEAMSMGVACITSPIANNSLEAKQNEEILVCKRTHETVEQIVRLLTDDNLRQSFASKGREFVKRVYNWETSGILELFEREPARQTDRDNM